MLLADRLHKTIAEIMAMPEDHLVYWQAYLTLQKRK